ILTSLHDPDVHHRLVAFGASGLVLTDHAPELLLQAIEQVRSGEIWLDRSVTTGVLARLRRSQSALDPELAKINSLTKREREIVALVGEGLKNRQIGERLFISEATVRNHLTSILDKLDLTDR